MPTTISSWNSLTPITCIERPKSFHIYEANIFLALWMVLIPALPTKNYHWDNATIPNPEAALWVDQDQLLMSLLIFSLSEPSHLFSFWRNTALGSWCHYLSRVVDCPWVLSLVGFQYSYSPTSHAASKHQARRSNCYSVLHRAKALSDELTAVATPPPPCRLQHLYF